MLEGLRSGSLSQDAFVSQFPPTIVKLEEMAGPRQPDMTWN